MMNEKQHYAIIKICKISISNKNDNKHWFNLIDSYKN